ncbi:MAG: CRISPR-associated helicase Cas3', partial [Phycisphaerales bacterium]|nr:CRISPR-associated helicase Cas3' [Phycisphaerales bacterium]
ASDSEDRPEFARGQAALALKAIGLRLPESRTTHDFTSTFGFEPSALQSVFANGLEPSDDGRLLLVESDTGSGKTEASLAWWLKLYAMGKVDGLYFALPTRVAAKELYERVRQCVERAFDEPSRPGPVLLAAPGYVKVDGERFRDTAPLPDPRGVLWDDRPQDAKRERLWSAERPKRFLAAPVAVGTIDQALLSVLRVKHSLLRSVCLDRHLLVVDEVHASDPYMREVLKALLRGHVARGGWALLLSATLGESAAAEFFGREIVSRARATERAYPAVTDRSGVHPVNHQGTARQVHLELSRCLDDDSTLVTDLTRALEVGARVLVVCNTVARANALFRCVEAALERGAPELLPSLFEISGVRAPHHGRFARADREALDARVSKVLGKGSPRGARLLIGTQTLEQSLDIDADWLITDLAPMDVLLQRIGRLHRHRREWRPEGFESPRVRLRIPARDLASYVDPHGALKGPAGLGRVYADGRVLQCTLDLLASRSTLVLPTDARALIEGTTHAEAFAELA